MSSISPPVEAADRPRATRLVRGYVKSAPLGRTCVSPGCGTALSRYNHATMCWLHQSNVTHDDRR
jgi:hypothetical protein